MNSVQNFIFDDALIFSDTTYPWDGRTVYPIAKINNAFDYSKFVIFDLPAFIKTDFFIIIQWDGFIIRGDQFSPHFFHYDYIGAPWPWFNEFRVGNGGFSWRSKKLAEAALDMSMKQRELFMQDKPGEDLWICRTNRVRLENDYGIHFSGSDIASHFSLEVGERRYPTFGFHGVFQLPLLYRDNLDWLLENLPPRMLEDEHHFVQVAEALRPVSASHHQAWLCKRGSNVRYRP